MRYLVLLIFLFTTFSFSQPYKEIYEQPFFKGTYPQKVPVLFRAYPFYNADSTFDVYIPIEIGHNYLQFLFDQDHYYAVAEIELNVSSRDANVVRNKIMQTEIFVDNFDATNDKTLFHFAMDSLTLKPGRYHIELKYRDLNGSRRFSTKQPLTLQKPKEVYASNPLFVKPNQPTHALLPGIAGQPSALQTHWDFDRDFSVFWEVRRQNAETPLPAYIELIDAREGKVVFRRDTTFTSEELHLSMQVNIPAAKLWEGPHRLKTVVKTGADSIRKIVPFKIVWFDKPLSLWDYDLAVQPLQHIVDKPEYKTLTSGKAEEKHQKLRDFWKSKDPTTDTPFNELKREFYSRVDSAIIRYSNKRALGWKTDPGRIYIALGPPDKVEDRSLEPIPTPYMRWTYLFKDKRLTYTFHAVDGRKEYELADAEESAL